MATTRIIPMHNNKGKTISQSLKARIDYVKNPEKTNGGELITAYACSPETADAEFLLARNEYLATTGRTHRNEVIAYQLRQSFKPGEVTPEEANQIGYELASQFLRGEHAFIVATHTDRYHIQKCLVEGGYLNDDPGADGYFGSATLAAVIKYQKKHGLQANGCVGDDVKRKLWAEYADILELTGFIR